MLKLVDCEFIPNRNRPIRHERGARCMALKVSGPGPILVCHSGIDFERCIEDESRNAVWFPGAYGWRKNKCYDDVKSLLKEHGVELFTLSPKNDQELKGFYSLVEDLGNV